VAFKQKSKKKVLKNYQKLKEKLKSLKYHDLKGMGNKWYLDSDELDNDLLSLDTDEYRDDYLDEYLECLDKEIKELNLNSIEYLKKALFG